MTKKWALGLIPAVLASFAFMFSFISSFWCESIDFSPMVQGNYSKLQFGPWYMKQSNIYEYEVGGETKIFVGHECVNYPSGTEVDSSWKTARAFSVITPIIGGLFTIALWFAPCLYFMPKSTWESLAVLFIVVLTLFQGLTLLFLKSNACHENPASDVTTSSSNGANDQVYSDECSWDAGSTANVVSVALWFLTGVAMLAVGVPKRPPRPPPETQEVTYEKKVNPIDGTATIVETTVVKGTAVPSSAGTEKPVVN